MGVTIATHNGSKVAREHNIRNERVTSHEAHIDPNGIHEIWHDEPIRQAYYRIFGDAQQAYNERQTRADRKIESYYNLVCKDAKKHPAYEMIIGIYGKEDGVSLCSEETGKEIMREFVEGWQERNPNLELIGAYYHADEEGEPHVHIDYVPVAHGYTKGMETQTGLVKALGEMGFEKSGKATAQIKWEARENAYLDALCKARGLEVEHPKEEGRKHIETEQFKMEKSLESTIEHYLDLEQSNITLTKQNIKLDAQNKALKGEISQLKGEIKELKELQKEKAGKTILGRPKNKIKLDYVEYRALQMTAREVQNVKKERKELEADKTAFVRKEAESRVKFQEIQEGKKEIEKLQRHYQKLINEQEQYITKVADKMVDEAFNGRETVRERRMMDYMDTLKLKDGRSVLDEFMRQERALEESLDRGWSR